jgi:uncharacterized protein YheU (UPF0270 family)
MADEAQPPVDVPYAELDAELLHAVVESYVLREGTDYGEREFSLADKVSQVLRQLKRGEARIMFDPESQSVSIVQVA